MKTAIAISTLILLAGVAVAAEAEVETFTGKYQWKQGGSDTLDARFEPTGDGTWNVSFRFKWNGSEYNWKGEAKGSLKDGTDVSGVVNSSDGRRTWKFDGSIEDGTLTGSHIETTGDRNYATGTFRVER